jgi:broad specificity phosphatase PhoE
VLGGNNALAVFHRLDDMELAPRGARSPWWLGPPCGETTKEVAARASRVLTRILPAMETGDVALIAHGHFLRVPTAVYLRLAPRFGAQITLDAGSVSVLSYYREQPAILSWNYGAELPMEP